MLSLAPRCDHYRLTRPSHPRPSSHSIAADPIAVVAAGVRYTSASATATAGLGSAATAAATTIQPQPQSPAAPPRSSSSANGDVVSNPSTLVSNALPSLDLTFQSPNARPVLTPGPGLPDVGAPVSDVTLSADGEVMAVSSVGGGVDGGGGVARATIWRRENQADADARAAQERVRLDRSGRTPWSQHNDVHGEVRITATREWAPMGAALTPAGPPGGWAVGISAAISADGLVLATATVFAAAEGGTTAVVGTFVHDGALPGAWTPRGPPLSARGDGSTTVPIALSTDGAALAFTAAGGGDGTGTGPGTEGGTVGGPGQGDAAAADNDDATSANGGDGGGSGEQASPARPSEGVDEQASADHPAADGDGDGTAVGKTGGRGLQLQLYVWGPDTGWSRPAAAPPRIAGDRLAQDVIKISIGAPTGGTGGGGGDTVVTVAPQTTDESPPQLFTLSDDGDSDSGGVGGPMWSTAAVGSVFAGSNIVVFAPDGSSAGALGASATRGTIPVYSRGEGGGDWVAQGDAIPHQSVSAVAGRRVGTVDAVTLSNSGTTLAVTHFGGGSNDPGYVRIYTYDAPEAPAAPAPPAAPPVFGTSPEAAVPAPSIEAVSESAGDPPETDEPLESASDPSAEAVPAAGLDSLPVTDEPPEGAGDPDAEVPAAGLDSPPETNEPPESTGDPPETDEPPESAGIPDAEAAPAADLDSLPVTDKPPESAGDPDAEVPVAGLDSPPETDEPPESAGDPDTLPDQSPDVAQLVREWESAGDPETLPDQSPDVAQLVRAWVLTGDDIIGAKARPSPVSTPASAAAKGKGKGKLGPKARAAKAAVSSPFLHDVGKAEAEVRLLADGGKNVEGRFLVRREGGSVTVFALSVVFKRKPTHHTLVRIGDGAEFALNRRGTGQTTLDAVVEQLRAKRAKWPVPLTEGVVPPPPPPPAPGTVVAVSGNGAIVAVSSGGGGGGGAGAIASVRVYEICPVGSGMTALDFDAVPTAVFAGEFVPTALAAIDARKLRTIAFVDLDGDGMMNRGEAEAQGMTPAMFQMIDVDRSGAITEEELVEFQRATTIDGGTVASSALHGMFSMAYLHGAEHTATTHSSIASVFYKRRHYDDALARYQTCLAIREMAFGSEHPSVAATQTDIAVTLTRIGGVVYTKALKVADDYDHRARAAGGDYDAAMELFERALVRAVAWHG